MYELNPKQTLWLSPTVCIGRVAGTQVVMFGQYDMIYGFTPVVTMAGKETLKTLVSFLEASIPKLYGTEVGGLIEEQIRELLEDDDEGWLPDRPSFFW